MPRLFRAALALFAMLFLFPLTALAAEGPFTIDLAPALGPLGEALITAIALGATWVLRRLLTYLGLKEDDRARAVLETAFHNGLQAAMERVLREKLDLAKVETRHRMVADGARYVLATVPGTLARFKMDEDGVRERLTARLGFVAPMPGQPVVFSPEIVSS